MTDTPNIVLFKNTIYLYGVQIVTYLSQFITIPYLARVLQPEAWGVVLFAQAFANFVSFIVEYGFNLSATREISKNRFDKSAVSLIVANVFGAKTFLFTGVLIVSFIFSFFIPFFYDHPNYFWLAVLMIVAQGFNPFWYFQGCELMRFPAFVNIFSRIFSTLCIFLFVRNSSDGWLVLALQGSIWLIGSLVNTIAMYSKISFLIPGMSESLRSIKTGFNMFVIKGLTSLYSAVNTFIVGLFLPASSVSFYGGSERITTAGRNMLNPISVALYPRMNLLVKRESPFAFIYARRVFYIIAAIGSILGISIFIYSDSIINLILGSDYMPAIPVLRVFTFVLVLSLLNNVLGVLWMLPLGMEKYLSTIIITAGSLNILLAIFSAPLFGAIGVAWSVFIAELLMLITLFVFLSFKGKMFLFSSYLK